MPRFRFGESSSFEINWEAFLVEMESVDADMADILRANKDKLVAIVRQGNRNANGRADFNASVMDALDRLLIPESQEEQT